MRSSINIVVAVAVLALPFAAIAAEPLSGEAVRKLFEGNTVSGRYMNRQFFTEYHHPDGRALGTNGWEINKDACWTTTENNVCYYYGPPRQRTIHCFVVELSDRLYILKTSDTGRVNAVATVEPGNPRNHTDNGTNWYCDGNISRGPKLGKRQFAAAAPWTPLPPKRAP